MTFRRFVALAASAAVLAGCSTASRDRDDTTGSSTTVITTSAIVADIVSRVAGPGFEVVSLIPNGFDSHTYEPRPSELEQLGSADLVVMADATLNAKIAQIVELSGSSDRVLDLNAVALSESDLIYRSSSASWNPHTWTDPRLVIQWVAAIAERLEELRPDLAASITASAAVMVQDLKDLDAAARSTIDRLPPSSRKLVVYHDAWEYFGRRYEMEVVGALQAVDFAEPSANELAEMAEQIKREGVPAFFGSEVFPSDVLAALERASGAIYVSDLSDDRLPGEPGQLEYSYVQMMRDNLDLLLAGLNVERG